jgi:transposase
MNINYIVDLDESERNQLLELTRKGKPGARTVKRAQILLMSDDGWADCDIADALPTSTSTIFRTKRRFVGEGLENAIHDKPRPGGVRKLSAQDEVLLIATACSDPPAGRNRWTLQLLADEMVRLTDHDSLSDETVRRRLAENELKPWQRRMWCIPKVNAEYVARMENILDLYTASPEEDRPVVSFDETPIQLIGEVRVPIPAQPGATERIDYEYKRNGTANLFVFVDVHGSWRHVEVTERRTKIDFANQMRDLVDIYYPEASVVRVVLDNLNTHRPAALYEAFPAPEARRILRRLEFHYTPKHASWLNMVEIEIGVLSQQCLNRRIPDRETLCTEVAAWQAQRNGQNARIRWMFGVEDARRKLGKAYPEPTTCEALADAA